MPISEAHNIAVYIDLENVAIGVRDAKFKNFSIDLVLQRLVGKGKIVVKKAYADWSKWKSDKRDLHEHGGDLWEMPGSRLTGKNSADIRMVVDALELSYTKPHIDIFALVSGDSDFSPLVTKLRENNKYIIGIGVKNSSSPILIDHCDEFLLYDDLARAKSPKKTTRLSRLAKKKRDAFTLLLDTVRTLQRENRDCHSSLVKDTMKRKKPQFNEEYHGYRSFTKLLEDAEKNKFISLRKDARSGTYVIEEITENGS